MTEHRNADRLGWRKKFGVIVPSTNTIVEPEFHAMSVPGVTPHMSRIHIRDMHFPDDEGMVRLLDQIRAEIGNAVDRVMTAQPDYMVMGMSAETFWDGLEGNRQFIAQIRERSGLDVATGAEGCERALKLFGARRIGVVTPYQPIGDENVVKFFGDLGFEVTAIKGLKCPHAIAIAEVTERQLMDAIAEVNQPDVDAVVQVRHQPVHVGAGRRGRAVAGQAGHRDQRRHVVDGPEGQRRRGQGPRVRLAAARALTAGAPRLAAGRPPVAVG